LFFADGTGSAAAKADGYIQYNHSNQALAFATGGASERMRIDSSGNVLVGKTSSDLTTTGSEVQDGSMRIVASSTSTNLATNSGASLLLGNPSNTANNFSNIGSYNTNQLVDSQINFIHESHSSRTGAISFNTHDGSSLNEAMRIDSSGNLLVGMQSSSGTVDGLRVIPNDFLSFTTNVTDADDRLVLLNRQASDGKFIEFRKANSPVGSIFSSGGQYLGIGNDDVGLLFLDVADDIRPWNTSTNAARDNAIDLGNSDARFKDLYLGGSIRLGGTGSANALDDYEEGTFNLTSTSSGYTLSSSVCRYTKIGNTVHVWIKIAFSAIDTNSDSSFAASGLPFSASTNNPDHFIGVGRETVSTGAIFVSQINNSSSSISINSMDGVSDNSNLSFQTGKNYNIQVTYRTG